MTTAEREELNRLRRENRQLELEREIKPQPVRWVITRNMVGEALFSNCGRPRKLGGAN